METTVLISKSKVYELALSSVKEQHINDFLHDYLPSISPIMAEYGGKFLISGTIRDSVVGKFPARNFAILEWPSIDDFIRINKDKRVIPLVRKRNRCLDFIIEGIFYGVFEDTSFEFPENRMMTLLLTDRAIPENRHIRLRWIDEVKNARLSLNLYFSVGLAGQYDRNRDIEEFSIQVS